MNRANLISLGVFFLVSIGMIPNSHAKSFQCNLKLDTFHLPSIAGCQMSLVNGKLVESYTSFFGNNQSLELDICPTDPLPPVKAKTVAKKLIKIAPYSPASGPNPEATPKANASGSATIPAVIPPNRSPRRFEKRFFI